MKKLLILILIIIILAAGWYFLSPLFINKTIDEALPETFSEFSLPSSEEFADMSEDEKQVVELEMIEMFKHKETVTEDPMSDMEEMRQVVMGNFIDADSFHQGSGIVKILLNNNGFENILRLENFRVTNGPDLHVLLVENPHPTNQDNLGEYVDLGELKGNIGNQNYTVPQDVDISKYGSVVIYCKPFHVIFSVATLQ